MPGFLARGAWAIAPRSAGATGSIGVLPPCSRMALAAPLMASAAAGSGAASAFGSGSSSALAAGGDWATDERIARAAVESIGARWSGEAK